MKSKTRRTIQLPAGSEQKVKYRHLERTAFIYVRQSTIQQISKHQESTRLQYGLVERAEQMGWNRERVEIIDEDLGRTATSSEGRPGFQRLLSEVCLDHVGIVLGIEMSRLARSCRDWYQLLEVCALFGTLIGDLDGIYDPAIYNDRLLLGLKGTISEAELYVIKQRMLQGKQAKARRGELGFLLPMGYVRRPSGEVCKDPDEQARTVVDFVFDQFKRIGTLNGVLSYLVVNKIRMPIRFPTGPQKGELQWKRPNRMTLSNLFHNPTYAGAYAYGRRPTDPKKKKPGRPLSGRTVAKPDEWMVLLKDHFPAYISWEQYEHNLAQLETNNNCSGIGVPRKGPSLLSGILICGRCGLRMSTQYTNNGWGLRYACSRMAINYCEPFCQSLVGASLDDHITTMLLRAIEPAALEVSLKVAEDLEGERLRLRGQWNQRLERAHYETERAFRQYDAVEPENRLVSRTLERRWEEAMRAEDTLKVEAERFFSQQPATLSVEEREAILALAKDLPTLWHSATTTAADRQAIVRQLIDRVIVTVEGESEKVDVHIHWAGGHKTQSQIIRPVGKLEQLSYYHDLLSYVAQLHYNGMGASAIAEQLNAEGWRPAKRRKTFNAEMVSSLLARQGLSRQTNIGSKIICQRSSDEWTVNELACELDMPPVTLYSWIQKGEVSARKVKQGKREVLLIKAGQEELSMLKSSREKPLRWSCQRRVNPIE